MGAGHLRVPGERILDRLAHLPRVSLGDCLHGADRLRVTAHGVRRLQMGLRIGRVEPDRLVRQPHGTLEQCLLLELLGDVVAVDRQRLRGECVSGRCSEPLCQPRRFNEATIVLGGARGFD